MNPIWITFTLYFLSNPISANEYHSNYNADSELIVMNKVASEIMTNLKNAKGILPDEPPHLTVRRFRGSQKIATMSLEKGKIHLDRLTYIICRKMGKDSTNALAFIIGHELGHYIHRHGAVNHNIDSVLEEVNSSEKINGKDTILDSQNVNSQNEIDIMDVIKNYNDTHDEAEADFEGGFLGYLAGYKPMAPGIKLLKNLYANPLLNLKKNIKGYPSLQQRLDIVSKTNKDMAALTPLFEMSNYLMAMEQYEDAIPYLEKVLEKFQSREIYNNIGVNYLLETMRLFRETVSEYKFPLTLDAGFRAPHPQFFQNKDTDPVFSLDLRKHQHCLPTLAQQQIEKAENYFQKAIQFDSDYIIAHLNLSIAQTLNGILFKGWECSDYRKAKLSNALGVATKSLDLAKIALSDFNVEYFEYAVSDTIEHVSIQDIDQLEELSSYSKEKIDSVGDTTTIMVRRVYPFRKEFFRQEDWSIKPDWENINSKYCKWNTDEETIPEQGVLLSNIYMQIDIVRCYMNELSTDGFFNVPYKFKTGERKTRPFSRSLELWPENDLALQNQNTALKKPKLNNQTKLMTQCSEPEFISGKSLTDFVNKLTKWDNAENLKKSKLITHFIKSQTIKNTEEDKLIEKYSQLNQTIQFSTSNSFDLYKNNSELMDDNRIEESIVYIPKNFSNLKTRCGIKIGDDQENIEQNYGKPARSILLSNGQLLVYRLNSKESIKKKRVPGTFFWNRKNYVSGVSNTEEGIIFKIDLSNTLSEWAIYQREISTNFNL